MCSVMVASTVASPLASLDTVPVGLQTDPAGWDRLGGSLTLPPKKGTQEIGHADEYVQDVTSIGLPRRSTLLAEDRKTNLNTGIA
ncbi:hypothetical protein GCM10027396_26870 [Insolitispirillum peregrinum]